MSETELAPGILVIDRPLRVAGLPLGTRTTAIRLSTGGLWVHSPGPLDDAARAALEKRGPVRALVAPNAMHHLFLPENAAAFPDAQVWAAPGVRAKRKEIANIHELGGSAPGLWSADLQQVAIEGIPRLTEYAFFHAASRTLLLTDLCFNVHHSDSWLTRTFMRLNRAWQRFGPSRMMRSMIRDKAALRGSLDRVLEWDFDRVVVTHGEVLAGGGRDALRDAFARIC
ncbi:MAG: DUF4336 domain-containing protein [Deltaproteobacteria bacterium]|nr:DUF4336 domain-containing protein [Deltaproteobacteria bacterium]